MAGGVRNASFREARENCRTEVRATWPPTLNFTVSAIAASLELELFQIGCDSVDHPLVCKRKARVLSQNVFALAELFVRAKPSQGWVPDI